jgi:hypothetical protein
MGVIMSQLGNINYIDVRTVWKNEASDITPWLAEEENIASLSDALGIELEVENTEVAVGPYSADILARDSGTGAYVVIENQLGKTNHDHLGKSITYAAVLDASAIVWVATEFSDEHRKALDWLNENSSDDLSFYGVRVELWQIDDSRPAIRFNVLSKPADILRKTTIIKKSEELSETRKLQLEWWITFRDALLQSKVVSSAQKPRPRYWYNVTLGRTGIFLSAIANTLQNKIGVRLYMRNTRNAEAALAQLSEQKDEIENEIGFALIWDANPDARDKVIAAIMEADLTNRAKWSQYCEWMVDTTERFIKTFRPRVKKLDLSIEEPEEIEE